jgi:ADP-heptose:LPS heptosyltransferase
MTHRSRLLRRVLGPFGRAVARFHTQTGYFADDPPVEPRRIALIACHWIGDTLWATQIVPPLATRWPDAEITAITKPACVDLWRSFVPMDRVIAVPEIVSDRRRERVDWTALRRRAADLRDRAFDLVVDLTGNRYSARFAFALRPAWGIGFDGNELGWLYSRNVEDAERPGRHLSERPLRVVEPLIGAFQPPATITPPEPLREFAAVCAELGLDPARPVAVIAPGAGWAAKEWPAERFAAVVERIAAVGRQVVAVGSRSQQALCKQSLAALPADERVVLCGRPIGEVCGLLSGAESVVGNDSGLGHLAAAYARRTVVVFTGETDPALCRPLGERVTVFDAAKQAVEPADVAAAALA